MTISNNGSIARRPLEGRRAVITGGAQGIGLAIATALTDAGAVVSVADLNPMVASTAGPWVYAATTDIRDVSEMESFAGNAARAMGGIDIVINNAAQVALSSLDDSLEDVDRAYENIVGTNLRGTVLATRACLPYMRENQSGDIVLIGTDHTRTCGYPDRVDHSDAPDCIWRDAPKPLGGPNLMDLYDASKWAVVGLSMSWARTLRAEGIRVNMVGMGATNTPMQRTFMAGRPQIPELDPAEIAGVLVDLVAEGPRGRTGDEIYLWPAHPVRLPETRTIPDWITHAR